MYGLDSPLLESSAFSEEDLEKMHQSLWYQDHVSTKEKEANIEKLTENARIFVAKNRKLIGKISDESFLKVMALSLALDHNNEFGIASARNIELFDLDTKDLIRVSVATRDVTMQDSSKSFSRFITSDFKFIYSFCTFS